MSWYSTKKLQKLDEVLQNFIKKNPENENVGYKLMLTKRLYELNSQNTTFVKLHMESLFEVRALSELENVFHLYVKSQSQKLTNKEDVDIVIIYFKSLQMHFNQEEKMNEYNKILQYFEKKDKLKTENIQTLITQEHQDLKQVRWEEVQWKNFENSLEEASSGQAFAEKEPIFIISMRWLQKFKKIYGPESAIEEELETTSTSEKETQMVIENQPEKVQLDILEGINFDLVDFDDIENLAFNIGDDKEIYNVPIKRGLVQGKDFTYITNSSWQYLMKRFQGIPLPRYCYKAPDGMKVEIWYKKVQFSIVADDVDTTKIHKMYYSDRGELGLLINVIYQYTHYFICDLKEQLSVQTFKVSPSIYKDICDQLKTTKQQIELNLKNLWGKPIIVGDAEIGEEDILMVEFYRSNGKYKIVLASKENEGSQSRDEIVNIANKLGINRGEKSRPSSRNGICGLSNLGNTCFMNSALQCSFSIKELADYFLTDEFIEHINETNKIGSGGRLAAAYGNLVKSIYYGTDHVVSPWEFKKMIAKKAPIFSGYAQQDSMELLSYLLDGLHEDLNQVKDKPVVPSIDVDSDENEAEFANQFWDNHLKRNKSKIVDLIHGQYKSKITCLKCNRISITYDPFSIVTLPLHSSGREKEFSDTFFVYYISDKPEEKPVKMTFQNIKGTDSLHFIAESIAEEVKAQVQNIEMHMLTKFEISESFEITVDNPLNASKINEKVALPFFYNINKPKPEELNEAFPIKVIMCIKEQTFFKNFKNVSYPRIFYVRSRQTIAEVSRIIYKLMRPNFFNAISTNLPKETPNDAVLEQEFEKYFIKSSPRDLPFTIKDVFNKSDQKIDFNSKDPIDALARTSKNTEIILDLIIGEKINVEDLKLNKCGETKISMKENTSKAQGFKNNTIYGCLELFSKPEKLIGDNMWYCNKCKMHVEASKVMNIWKTSKYLIFQLNRFKVDKIHKYGRIIIGGGASKNDSHIQIPTDSFDLSDFILEKGSTPKIYDLIAVSNHYGSCGGGHYTATIRHYSGKWIYCNDSSVSNGEKGMGSEAYLLIYQRKSK